MTTSRHALFVYGTLLSRCRNPMSAFLAERGDFQGPAQVAGRLYDLGSYPAAVPSDLPGEWIHGEWTLIDDEVLAALDRYEGIDGAAPFRREQTPMTTADEQSRLAWIYWLRGPLPATDRRIESGRYEPAAPLIRNVGNQ